MKVSKKSWHYQLMRFAYEKIPTNLCPYFWKLVLAILLLPIVLPLNTIVFIIRLFKKDFVKPLLSSEGFSAMFFINFVCYFLFCTIGMWWFPIESPIFLTGVCIWLIAIISAIGWLIGYCRKKRRYNYSKNPNILVEFIKAKKKKYCPQLTFE